MSKIYDNKPMSSARVQEIQHRMKEMHQQTTGKNPSQEQQAKYKSMVIKEAKKLEGRR